ncbi:hypothetical protein ELUCI_v1c01370 [Williamsoniiplasma lucivorax]|uniref:Uncharacterized protein n=2 Tax=Williamsoniiplasma lucivorax TaxID=209274 RepID=A0A2S5REU5_9MOLU|nr:hypothetical protein ELUCI_v1c01370 [Williamsoniiplasma lucivorax]
MIATLITYSVLLILCIFYTILYAMGNRLKNKIVYNMFEKEINFKQLPLYFKTMQWKNLSYYLVFMFSSSLIFILFTCWTIFLSKTKNEELIVYLSISIGFWIIHLLVILWFWWRNNKLMWSQNKLYFNYECELKNKLSLDNFKFNINYHKPHLITLKNTNWWMMYLFLIPTYAWFFPHSCPKNKIKMFEAKLNFDFKKCQKKLMKLPHKNRETQELKIFITYLKNVSLFIFWMEKLHLDSMIVDQKLVYFSEFKKVIIENFFYYKNLAETQK